MKKASAISGIIIVLVLAAATSVAVASNPGNGAETESIVRIFDGDGNSLAGDEVMGTSKLIRRDDGLNDTAHVSGLIPGGVYTFWWVVIPDGGTFPDNAFVAHGGARVAGQNGKATVRMTADAGQPSVTGFLIDFQPLDFDLGTAEVHVEIAYHGQAEDAGDDLGTWMSDFWTGTACPAGGVQGETQPHCPVSIVAVHTP